MSVELLDIDRASVAILGSVWAEAPGGRCSDTGRPLSAIGYLGRIKETAYKMYTIIVDLIGDAEFKHCQPSPRHG